MQKKLQKLEKKLARECESIQDYIFSTPSYEERLKSPYYNGLLRRASKTAADIIKLRRLKIDFF
jgi:hypothetical protein